MQKHELLEAISILIHEEITKVLREDKALKMSDDRRRKFLKVIMSNPINEEGILPDEPVVPQADIQPADGNTAPVDASPDFGEPMTPGQPGGSTSDMGAAMDSTGGGSTGAPGPAGDDGADLGTGEEGDLGGDLGGGDGGLGGGFGGGGGGGGMDMGGGEDGEDAGGGPETPEPSYDPFKDASTISDRLQVIIDQAEEIANQTQDPQKVLKTVKGLIQNGFSRPEEAAKTIADLFDTNNPVLQQVSRRLALFMQGI